MWAIKKAYLRARKQRLIKTIICTTCAGIGIFIYGIEFPYSIAILTIVWTIWWQLFSINVDSYQQIHLPGGMRCRKR